MQALHDALIDVVIAFNRPRNDEAMVQAAGLTLDRALFPLLVGIERRGPLGVVELADGVGRDHTTVSRQVAKLEEIGLVTRRPGAVDRRVRESVVTPKGQAAVAAIDAVRERRAEALFEDWQAGEIETFVRLLRRFADEVKAGEA